MQIFHSREQGLGHCYPNNHLRANTFSPCAWLISIKLIQWRCCYMLSFRSYTDVQIARYSMPQRQNKRSWFLWRRDVICYGLHVCDCKNGIENIVIPYRIILLYFYWYISLRYFNHWFFFKCKRYNNISFSQIYLGILYDHGSLNARKSKKYLMDIHKISET